jgi:hypothetical protein
LKFNHYTHQPFRQRPGRERFHATGRDTFIPFHQELKHMSFLRISQFCFLAMVLALAVIAVTSNARAQSPPDSLFVTHDLREAYGLRLGTVGNYFANKNVQIPNPFDAPPAMGGLHPAFNPYYEAPLERGLTASYELMLVYKSWSVFGLSDFSFQSYGFDCELRWDPPVMAGDAAASQRMHLYYGCGAGFDTYDDRLSISVPLSAGELIPFSNRAELEIAARIAPQLFLGNGLGMYYGITAGIRILNSR